MSYVRPFYHLLAVALTFTSLSGTGCSTFSPPLNDLFGEQKAARDAAQLATQEGPKYTVEFVDANGRRTGGAELPWQESLCVQDALQQSGALKQFGRIKIQVYRGLPRGGQHKLDVAFDRGKRRVPPSYDYALRPGDRVVFVEDTSTILDDMLGSLSGPLGAMAPKF